MNPNLVKRGLDDEEYASACPSVFHMMLAHLSMPNLHRPDVYSADSFFFSLYPERRCYLRPAFDKEWDIEAIDGRPTLWCLVTQIAPGHHLVLPVYRGKSTWNGPESASDEGVASILYQMGLRQGTNLSEWMSFIYDRRVNKSDKARDNKRRKNPTVN